MWWAHYISCSPDLTTNSETMNSNFYVFFSSIKTSFTWLVCLFAIGFFIKSYWLKNHESSELMDPVIRYKIVYEAFYFLKNCAQILWPGIMTVQNMQSMFHKRTDATIHITYTILFSHNFNSKVINMVFSNF